MPSPANSARDLRLPDFIGVGPGRTGTTCVNNFRTFGASFSKTSHSTLQTSGASEVNLIKFGNYPAVFGAIGQVRWVQEKPAQREFQFVGVRPIARVELENASARKFPVSG